MPEATNILCPDCRYSLKGLVRTENQVQCPECGRVCTDDELSPVDHRRRRWLRLQWQLFAGITLQPAIFAFAFLVDRRGLAALLVFCWNWACVSIRFMADTRQDKRDGFETLPVPYFFDLFVGFFLAFFLLLIVMVPLSVLYEYLGM